MSEVSEEDLEGLRQEIAGISGSLPLPEDVQKWTFAAERIEEVIDRIDALTEALEKLIAASGHDIRIPVSRQKIAAEMEAERARLRSGG